MNDIILIINKIITAFVGAEITESAGGYKSSSNLREVFMPVSEIKEALNPEDKEKTTKPKN